MAAVQRCDALHAAPRPDPQARHVPACVIRFQSGPIGWTVPHPDHASLGSLNR